MDIDIEHQSDEHYVQSDGGDIVFIEENGDGTARVVVYDSNHPNGNTAWEGEIRIDGTEATAAKATAPRTVLLEDLLSGSEAAALAGVSYDHLRVLLGRGQFPAPARTSPSLWLREDVADWLMTRG